MIFETVIGAVFIFWALVQNAELEKYKEAEARRKWSEKAVEEYKIKQAQEEAGADKSKKEGNK